MVYGFHSSRLPFYHLGFGSWTEACAWSMGGVILRGQRHPLMSWKDRDGGRRGNGLDLIIQLEVSQHSFFQSAAPDSHLRHPLRERVEQ